MEDVTNVLGGVASQFCLASQILSDNDSGFDFEIMDDSLTDIQWLQKMDASAEIPGMKCAKSRKRKAPLSESETKSVPKDSCRKKLDYCSGKKGTSNKPPLSYASLIALAICSTPQRMLTLSGIYKWIENTFPFYRTPEAKAWKNSIRHNLSIRKGMFMKVYQYPPRRGNGSYWTLLSDGEDELKRAIPLFSTFQPPIIDTESVYNRTPATYTVKSRGQFVPVLPRSSTTAGSQPYFSMSNSSVQSANHHYSYEEEVLILQSSGNTKPKIKESANSSESVENSITANIPVHLLEHSYAKLPEGLLKNSNTNFDATPAEVNFTPKRMKPETPIRRYNRSSKRQKYAGKENCSKPSITIDQPSTFTTPTRDQDISLSFLNASLLTPLKDIVNDIEIGGPGGMSLSPLYANFISPENGNLKHPISSDMTTSPLTPLRHDSGIFTPFRPSDSLDSLTMKCSTPLKLFSPISNILPPLAGTPQDTFSSLKVVNNSPNNSIRLGSLQALGLPGLTPPSTCSVLSR